jgi:hypothetical protein
MSPRLAGAAEMELDRALGSINLVQAFDPGSNPEPTALPTFCAPLQDQTPATTNTRLSNVHEAPFKNHSNQDFRATLKER